MKMHLSLAAASVLAIVESVSAQTFSLDRFAIAGGGGTRAGGTFVLNGTSGQFGANPQPLTGGNFSLTGGFWSLAAVQTPGAPLLSIRRTGAGVRVFWPLPATGFVLEQSPTVTGAWLQIPFPYATNATDISITTSAPSGNSFYRLRKP